MTTKLSLDYINIFIRNNGFDVINFNEYSSVETKIEIKDKDEYKYLISFHSFSSAIKNNINIRKFDKSNPFTIHNIKLWIKENNKPYKLLSNEYFGNSKNLLWKCLQKDCGEKFFMSWHSIWDGERCSFCSGSKTGSKNNIEFLFPEICKDWDYENNVGVPKDYVTSSKYVPNWRCHICGYKWKNTLSNRTIGKNGCPACGGKVPTLINNLLLSFPYLSEEWDYKKNKLKPENYTPYSGKSVYWICSQCGYKWKARIADRTSKNSGCNLCRVSGEVKRIYYWLKNNNFSFDYDNRNTFPDLVSDNGNPLRYDFIVYDNFEKNGIIKLIEFDGEQHEKYIKFFHKDIEGFEEHKNRDTIKNLYAIKNSYNLLRIKNTEKDKIENILEKEFYGDFAPQYRLE